MGFLIFLTLGVLLGAASGCSRSTPEGEEETGAQAIVTHAHAQAGETCFICDAAKREPGRLWCTEHARYEDRCWICQPHRQRCWPSTT